MNEQKQISLFDTNVERRPEINKLHKLITNKENELITMYSEMKETLEWYADKTVICERKGSSERDNGMRARVILKKYSKSL